MDSDGLSENKSANTRRQFLTGQALRGEIERAGTALADHIARADALPVPRAGDTIRLGKPAMACDFDVILNPEAGSLLSAASAALDLVDRLEDQMTVYRPHSELSRINAHAAEEPMPVEPQLFDLLRRAERISAETDAGFDPTSGPLVALWRRCKQEGRIPADAEIAAARELVGFRHVQFDAGRLTVRYARPGVEMNLGSIGKGYALDRAGDVLHDAGATEWMLHGGHSSILARGGHAGWDGWPVGIRNPLFPERRLATLLLKNRGLSTSGSGVQFFRVGGKRYGHILDPRTGWPVEETLSVTVLAPNAAEADALSTAFFVIGVEKTRAYCHNRRDVSALIIPAPARGKRLEPINCGIPEEQIFFA